MEVYAFRAPHTARIGIQAVIGGSGRDFAVYIGVVPDTDGVLSHRPFEPTVSGGGGLLIPEAAKVPYSDAKAFYGGAVEDLERKGLRYRH